VISIRASRLRLWLAALAARVGPLRPILAHDAVVVGTVAGRLAGGVRHQYAMSQAARHYAPPPRDPSGRRLRASAHGTGPRMAGGGGAFGAKPPVDPTGWVPGAVKVALVFVLATAAFLGSSQAYIDFAAQLPDAHALAAQPVPEDSIIYAADGTTELADVHLEGVQHYYEPVSNMGKLLPQATIAIEDSGFYNEVGIDPVAMARAALVDWRSHGTVQGASTITQQLVKLRLLDSAPTIDRKVKEAFLAIQVERAYSKQQILEMYLNTVHYGNNAQGTRAAALIYFHKPTKDLDLAQASMLAGIPQSPLYNSPITNWNQAKARQQQVLNAMVRNHMVTQAEADAAYAEDISPKDGKMFTAGEQILAFPAFTSWVIDLLTAKYGKKTVQGGGLRVTTTIDPKLQGIAEQALLANLNAQRWRGASQSAMAALDPHTGAVVAMVGAADPNGDGHEFNFAVWPPRNPGSSFKIFNYTAAIASGKWTMVTPVSDSPGISIIDGSGQRWTPENYGGSHYGTVQLQQAMGNSLNIQAVKVELGTGVETVLAMARAMGAPPFQGHGQPDGSTKYTNDDPPNSFGPSLTLGGYGETPLQMAQGAQVLAAQGILHPAYGVTRVTTSDGTEIFKADPAKDAKQVLDPKVAWIMEAIMSDDSNRAKVFGTGTPLTLPGRQVAAKTGTTDDFRDAWTLGYTPDLASAVWVGEPHWHAMVNGSDGVFVAAPGWHNFMQGALDAMGKGNVWFSEPAGLQHFNVGGKLAYFLPGTNPNQPAPPLPPNVTSAPTPAPKRG
jgi:membrane peptidoglycan carboxypeptidase